MWIMAGESTDSASEVVEPSIEALRPSLGLVVEHAGVGWALDAATHERMRERMAFQGTGVDSMRRTTRGSNGDAKCGRKFVALDARDDAVDDLCRIVEVGVEQHERKYSLVGVCEEVRIPDLFPDDLCDVLEVSPLT
jgi:hypothetical protein